MPGDGFPVALDGPAEPAEELPVRERPEVQRRKRTYHDHPDEDGNERSGIARCRAHQSAIPTVRALATTAEPRLMTNASRWKLRPPRARPRKRTGATGLRPAIDNASRSACDVQPLVTVAPLSRRAG